MKLMKINPSDMAGIVKELASFGHNQKEIAQATGLSFKMVREQFLPEYAAGRLMIQKQLRKRQLEKAFSGNVAMLIHLGKFYLNQTDAYLEVSEGEEVKELDSATTAELLKLVRNDLDG